LQHREIQALNQEGAEEEAEEEAEGSADQRSKPVVNLLAISMISILFLLVVALYYSGVIVVVHMRCSPARGSEPL